MNKPLTSLPTVYPLEIAHKGEEVYRKISRRIEKKHLGDFVAIEVESGKYFLGQTQIEAIEKAKKHFPNKIFYLMKVGFPAVVARKHPKIKLTVVGCSLYKKIRTSFANC